KTGKPQIVDLSAGELKGIEFERWREPELILLKAADPSSKLAPAPDETIDGKPHAVVKLTPPTGTVHLMLYIDKKTKLVSRVVYHDGASSETDEFSDYRTVQGIKIAHKRKSHGTGRDTRST